MKILVTGSSGFLGSHCVNTLRACGHLVTGQDIKPAATTDIVADVRSSLPNEFYDILIHFAAEVLGRENIEHNYLSMVANIEIDRVAFQWAVENTNKIIYPSSSAVYPVDYQQDQARPLKESMIDFATNTIGVSDHLYGWTKLTAERMLWEINKTHGMDITILRPFSGYGPGQSLDYPMANLVNLVKTSPDKLTVWGTGEQTRDFVHVNDIINVVDWAISTPGFNTLNIGSGTPTSFNTLIQLIYQLKHNSVCPSIQCLTEKPMGVMHRVADIQKQIELGLVPQISLANGIKTLL